MRNHQARRSDTGLDVFRIHRSRLSPCFSLERALSHAMIVGVSETVAIRDCHKNTDSIPQRDAIELAELKCAISLCAEQPPAVSSGPIAWQTWCSAACEWLHGPAITDIKRPQADRPHRVTHGPHTVQRCLREPPVLKLMYTAARPTADAAFTVGEFEHR